MNRKMIVGIGLLIAITAIAFSAAPIQAHFDGSGHGDLLQTQEIERLRTRECDCNGDLLQTQEQERLRTQNRSCNDECTKTQCDYRQSINECATNRVCNCTRNTREYRNQNREKTNLGD